jgi:pimeloyl-ACP methyl ester carboxylesterase
MLADGDKDGALTTFLTDAVGLEERVAVTMRRTPFWPASIALAHTLPYDTRLREESGLDGLAGLNLPSLLLVGERSSAEFHHGGHTLAATLPNGRLSIVPGQGHNAMREAPDLLAKAVLGISS